MASYWEGRKDLNYYQAVRGILDRLGQQQSILDVGSWDTPVATWGKFNRRYSVDPRERPKLRRVKAIQGSWPESSGQVPKVSVVTCLQVIEHLPGTLVFVNALFEKAIDLVIISVPYKWPVNTDKHHVHDPIDESKLVRLVGREPDMATTILDGRCRRLIAEYHIVRKVPVSETMNCIHRSQEFNPEWCRPCKRSIKVFECDIHDKCTLGKKLVGISCCNDKGNVCPDYSERGN